MDSTPPEKHKLWKSYQRDYWIKTWENSAYSIKDMIDGDEWVGVKYSPLLPYIQKYTSKNVQILEAGCGVGQWVVYLAGLGYNITGLDFAEPTIKKLQSFYPNLKFIVGDITDLQFSDESFGAILSWGVIEHFQSGPTEALSEAFRVLTKKGILYVTVPCKNYLSLFFCPLMHLKRKIAKNKLIRKMRKKKQLDEKFFEYSFTKKQFKKYIIESGFKITEIIPISHEVGFAKTINSVLGLGKKAKIFHKNKTGKWAGLTNFGDKICRFIKKISLWITPDQIFIVATKE